MALQDVTNGRPQQYECRVSLDSKYEALIKKGVRLDFQLDKKSFSSRRQQGGTNIDLWIDGNIYPKDPRTLAPPPISTLKELLMFVGDGERGLFGYTHALARSSVDVDSTQRIHQLEIENESLRKRIQFVEEQFSHMQNQLEKNLLIIQNVEEAHKLVLQKKEKALKGCKAKLERLRKEGYIRQRKPLSQLKPNSGNAKKKQTQVRQALQPQSAKKARLESSARENASAIALCFNSIEKEALVQEPNMAKVVIKATNSILAEVGEQVQPGGVLAACDRSGVSQKGYAAIHKTLRTRMKLVHKGLRLGALPNPNQISILRRELNANLPQYVGEYYSLSVELPSIGGPKKGKCKDGEKPRVITLSSKNSLFVDLEMVQRSMVKFYNVTTQELQGRPIIFVLKLDEAKIINDLKLERVSITIMNRALDDEVTPNDPKYFSVQSDQEIWPIACFQVVKESHEQLKFIFSHTPFPEVIGAQNAGRLLEVPDMGSYKVEWHLSADMKIIKCMYGLKHGANAKHAWIYCLQERMPKRVLATEAQAIRERKKQTTPAWKGGLFNRSTMGAPTRGCVGDIDFDPVLPIPLTRVHICCLHANNRIVEKMLHLHFMYVWNMKGNPRQEEAIVTMETALSKAGIHGGNVSIFKDIKLSGNTGSVPKRLSMNGAHVKSMFKGSPWSGKDKLWKDVVEAEHHTDPNLKLLRMQVWDAYEDLQVYLKGLTITPQQRTEFKSKVEKWAKLFISTYGEEHVTHYMHVLVKHGPWFMDTYVGGLSVWSCQGMEKSHASAKSAYHRHTQHGGGRRMTSPLVQVWQHWYRNIQHREMENEDIRT